jgi:four helix bundle protein
MYESEKLKARTKQFAVALIRLFRTLPGTEEARLVGRQMIRAASSVAANYRAAGRARSRAEFIAKIGTVVEEIDETVFWIEMLSEADILGASATKELLREANELLAIFAASQRTARKS